MIKNSKLKEKIYSPTTAIAYHRTDKKDFIDIIKNDEFRPGMRGGIMYGPALYCTYELESQLNDRMRNTYGPYIIKYKIPIENYLIFDKDHAEQIFGKGKADIVQQLQRMNPDYGKLPLDVIEINRQFIKEYKDIANIMYRTKNILTPMAVLPFSDLYDAVLKLGYQFYNDKNWIKNKLKDNKEKSYQTRIKLKDFIRDCMEETIVTYFSDKLSSLNNFEIESNSYTTIVNIRNKTEKLYNNDRNELTELFISVLSDESSTKMKDLYIVLFYKNPINRAINEIEKLEERYENEKYTSLFVQNALPLIKNHFPQVKGLIFTGRGDGKIIIAYNWNECVPLAAYEESLGQATKGYTIPIINKIIEEIKSLVLSNLGEHLYVGNPPKLETTGEYFTLEQEDDIEEFLYYYKPIETYDKIIPVTDKIISMLDSPKVPFYELEKKFNILISIKYLWADSYGKNVDDNKLDLEITTYLFNAGSPPEIRHIMKLVGFDPTKDLSDKEQLVQIAKSSSEVLKVFIDKAKQSNKSNLE